MDTEKKPTSNLCNASTRSGAPCGKGKEIGSDYCNVHTQDLDRQAEIRQQRRKAALIRHHPQNRENLMEKAETAHSIPLNPAELQDLLTIWEADKQVFLREVTRLTMTNRLSPAQAREIRQMVKLSASIPESAPVDPTEGYSDEEYRELLAAQLEQLDRKIALKK